MSTGRYGTVHASFWTDEKTSQLTDQAKLLAIYLMTGIHATSSGSMRVPDAYVSADLGWSIDQVRKAFAELIKIGFIIRHPAGWTVIRNRLKYDPPQNPKHLQSIIAKIDAPRGWAGYVVLHQTLKPWCEKYGIPMEPPATPPSGGPGKGIKNEQETVSDTLFDTVSDTSVTVSVTETVSIDQPSADLGDLPAATNVVQFKQAPTKPAPDATFDEWWRAYPRKVGKGHARRAYVAKIRAKVSPADLLSGLHRSVDKWRRDGTEIQYIPHPAKWLNGERWDDAEPDQPSQDIRNTPGLWA